MPHKLISIGVGRRWPAGTYDNERDHVVFDTWVLNRNQFHIPHFGTNHGICNENKFPGNFIKRRRRRFWGTSFWSSRILIKILSSALHFFAKILAIKKPLYNPVCYKFSAFLNFSPMTRNFEDKAKMQVNLGQVRQQHPFVFEAA